MACFVSCDDGGGLVLWTPTGGQRGRFAARRLQMPPTTTNARRRDDDNDGGEEQLGRATVKEEKPSDECRSWTAIAFSPDSRLLACAGVADGAGGEEGVARTLSLFATTTDDASSDGDVVCSRSAGPELRCPEAGFTAVAWVPGSQLRLVTGTSSGVVTMWDYLRGEVLWERRATSVRHSSSWMNVAVEHLEWGGHDSKAPGLLVAVFIHQEVRDPYVLMDSKHDFSSSRIVFYSRMHESSDADWAERRVLNDMPGEVRSLCLAAMTAVAYRESRHSIIVYSLYDGNTLLSFARREFECSEVPRALQLSPDGSKLVGGLGVVWDARTCETAFPLQTDVGEATLLHRTYQLKWSPDGSSLLTTTKYPNSRNSVFRLWDTVSPETPFDEEPGGCLMKREFAEGHRPDSTIMSIAWSAGPPLLQSDPPPHSAATYSAPSADNVVTHPPPHQPSSPPSPRPQQNNDAGLNESSDSADIEVLYSSWPPMTPRTAGNAASTPTKAVDKEIKKMLKGFKMQASDEAFKKSLSSIKVIGRGSRGALDSVSNPEETLQQLRNLLVVGDTSRSAVRAKEHKQLIAQALQELLNVTIEADGSKPGMGAEGSSSPELKAFMAHYADTWIKAAVLAYALLELQLKRKSQSLKRQQNRKDQQESGGADSSRRPVIAPSNPLSASAHARGAATSSSSPMAAASAGGISSAGDYARRPPLSSPLAAAKVASPQPTLPATSSAGRSRSIQQDATPAASASLRYQHQSPSSSTPTKLTSANTTKLEPHVTASPSNSAAAPNAEHRRTSAATQRQPSPSLPIPPSPHFEPHVKSEAMTECEIGTQPTDEQQEGRQRAQPGKQESMSAPTVASTLANAPDHERKLNIAGASASSMSRALDVQDGRTVDGPSGTAGTSNKRPASDSLTAMEHGGGEDGGSRKLARVESMSRTDASGSRQRPPNGVSGTVEEELERSTRSDGGGDGSGDMDSDVEEEAVVQAGAVGGGGSGTTTPPSNDRALSRAESEYVPILTVELPESQALDDDLDATLSSPAGEEVSAADVSGAGASAVAGERAGDDADVGGSAGSNKQSRLTSPVVYPKQKEVASELLLKMERQIGKSGVDEFDQLAFFIQVPNLNSLLGQTLTRVGEFLEAHRAVDSAFFPEVVPEEVVYKGAPASSWVAMFEGIKERIRTEPRTLFLFVHDEAHWSPTVGTAGYFINDDLLRRSPNVFTLFVSATPYNLLTQDSQVPEENEHQWFTPNEITSYYGLKRYLEPQQEGICNVGGGTTSPPLAPAAAAPLRGCPPGSIVKDTLLYNAAEARMPLPQKLREAWLTGKHAEAEYAEDEAFMNKSAQLRKLKTLMALEVRYVAAFLQAMGRLPSELPAGATLSMPDSSPLPELPENDLTLEMVRQLVSPAPNGRGIMILLRVADHKSGRLLYNSIRRVRGFLGLQSRIAVIIDINQTEAARSDDTSFGLKETIEPPLLRRLLQLQVASGVVGPEADAPLVRQYSDLDGLPCVLILCEKGKMGDTFPPSLRFYDLRLRYINNCNERAATEQDLGRAFRYHNPGAAGGVAELPTIIVSQQLYNALMGKRGGRRGLLRYDPARPDLMRSVGGKKAHSYPDQGGPHPESDTAAYRAHWAAGPKHFDNKENRAKAEGCWLANPRRFVLAAAPQIGKTGAFLHLIYLLWCRYIPRRAIEPTPPPLLPSPSSDATNSSLSSEQTNGGTDGSSAAHMALFPSSALLSSSPASFPAGSDAHVAGMYGDPSRSPEYDWYMAGNRGRCPFATPAAAVDEGGREEGLHPMRFSAQPSLVASVERWTGRSAEVRLPSMRSTTTRDRMEGPSSAAEAMVVGRLHIPHSHDVANAWLPDFPSSFKLQPPAAASNAAEERRGSVLRTPIFVPSCGRPAAALLDWAAAMEDWDYLQVVVVKSEELASYMAHWPGHVFFELPPEASALGIGAARFAIYHLAELMVGSPNAGGCRCAYLLDDRLLAWKIDVGLHNDPYAAKMNSLAMSSCTPGIKQPEGRLSSIPMPVALSFMEAATDLSGVGVVGFRCYGGGPVHWREAYARSPVGSAVLLNLSELTRARVVYDPSLFAWEDIDLSRRASGQERAGVAAAKPPGLMVAECRRFVVVKKVIPKGGCVDGEEGDIELEDISASTDETEWPSEEGEEGGSRVALRSLSHLQVGRFVEWALGEVWGAPHQRAAQHVVAQRVVSLGIDGSVLEEETDIVDELASELKGASRRAALREAIDAAKAAGGIPQEVVDAWDAVPADQSLPATSP